MNVKKGVVSYAIVRIPIIIGQDARPFSMDFDNILKNEKYVGEVLMQKTYTADLLTGRRGRSEGQLDIYLVEDTHEPIIARETFELVQRMKGNIKK